MQQLTDRQQHWIESAKRLASRFAERAAAHDRENTFPFENFRELHEAGLVAMTAPEEYGGGGAHVYDVVLMQEELAKGDASTALGLTMHLTLVGRLSETRIWPEATFERLARDIVARGALINAAHSEPELGSPSRGGMPRTTAARTEGGWRINGHKRWTSLSPALSYFYVLAQVQDEGPVRRGFFLVPAETPGIEIVETWDNLGMRATGSHDVVLTNVEVPADALVPNEGGDVPGQGKGWGGLVTSAVYLGIATAARDAAVEYARTRQPNGMDAPIASLGPVQHRIARTELLLLQSRTLLHDVAKRWVACPEERDSSEWQLAAAKYTVSNNAIQVVDQALRVTGTAGLSKSMPLERYYRDVRTSLNQPPIDDAALTMIGKAALEM